MNFTETRRFLSAAVPMDRAQESSKFLSVLKQSSGSVVYETLHVHMRLPLSINHPLLLGKYYHMPMQRTKRECSSPPFINAFSELQNTTRRLVPQLLNGLPSILRLRLLLCVNFRSLQHFATRRICLVSAARVAIDLMQLSLHFYRFLTKRVGKCVLDSCDSGGDKWRPLMNMVMHL